MSATVHDQIHVKLPYTFEHLGEQNLKNIAGPVRVFAHERFAGQPSSPTPLATPASKSAEAPRLSIVVLPFANLSSDAE